MSKMKDAKPYYRRFCSTYTILPTTLKQ